MIGFIATVEFVWGFQSRIVGYSKTSPSFYYPPPTTILGALAERIAREYDLGEKRGKEIIPRLAQNLLALGVKPINCVPIKFSDINRLIATKLTSGIRYPSPHDISGSFDAPATGKTLMASMDGKPPQLFVYAVFRNDSITYGNIEVSLTKDHFWGIHRLGSKESIVSTLDVLEFEPEMRQVEMATTQYSFPLLDGVIEDESVVDQWAYEVLINPFRVEAYDEEDNPVKNYVMAQKITRYKVPIIQVGGRRPLHRVKLEKGFCLYVMDDELLVGICP